MVQHDYQRVSARDADSEAGPPSYDEAVAEYGTPVWDTGSKDDRLAFVRRVYAILSVQLLVTTAVCVPALYLTDYRNWMIDHSWTIWLAFAAAIGSNVYVATRVQSNKASTIPLGIFTLAFSYMVSFSAAASDPATVVLALFITLSIFLGLTLFTLQSRIQFDKWPPYLFGGLWLVIIASFVAMFFPYSSTQQLVLGAATALVFSGYIMYDTYLVMKRLAPGQEVLGAMSLYVDVLNLFLAILRILSSSSSSSSSSQS